MRRHTGQSERLGRGIWWLGQGRLSCRIYRALAPVTCAGCGRQIAPGERFIRHGISGQGTRTFPFCADCERFTDQPSQEAAGTPRRDR